ncbi:MAG: filamentous hemagglutinin N-terminal domain-containing protein [Leptolyngbyaceae cyanobacterium bins.302]|nr:filamentous hemagglutinin N-terminal domain-containing protein [Leptolyngbyaceae cyanobacterium bins.302]
MVDRASAQLELIPDTAPDRNLGTQVQQNVVPGVDVITGGTRPQNGQNLFHSFQDFNIRVNRGAYFDNPAGVRNILTRITGTDPSDILGTLGVLGSANLFFINPNGILFGRNASLDLRGGSFYGTTASGIKFGDLGEFSAVNPQPPSNLLTINPSAFFFTAQPSGAIVNRSQVNQIGLQVPNGQTLLLLGGNVTVDGGGLNALNGRIEIGAIAEAGNVTLNSNGSLSVPNGLQRGDVTITNGSLVNVQLSDRGDIGITGNNINILNSSQLFAGIDNGRGTTTSQAGDITINATGALTIFQSQITNWVNRGATGNGGNIFIDTDSLSFTGSGFISASTFGTGNAGSVRIQANNDIRLDFRGNIFSLVEIQAEGNAGNIEVSARNLYLSRGARISAGTLGRGNAGNVILNIGNSISLDGTDPSGRLPLSGIYSSVFNGAEGRGGDIRITTGSLSITNSARLDARVSGKGDGGNIIVNARGTIFLNGTEPSGDFLPSGMYSSVVEDAEGRGGDIRITTGSLSITNSAKLDASVFGKGDGGNIIINARDSVILDGVTRGYDYGSAIFATIEEEGIGSAGDIRISTGSLFVLNGGTIQTRTQNQGDAGNILIDALDSVIVDGAGINYLEDRGTEGLLISNIPSEISSDVEIGARGNAGNIVINAGNNILLNPIANEFPGVIARSGKPATDIEPSRSPFGVIVRSQTSGLGNAGNIVLNAGNQVSIDNEGEILANTTRRGIGDAGNVSVSAGNLVLLNNEARIFANTNGIGDAGNVSVSAGNLVLLNNDSVIFGTVERSATGSGGNINISTAVLSIANGSQLQTRTFGQGDAGNVTIDARNRVNLDRLSPGGFRSSILATTEENSSGAGGNILIKTSSLALTNDAAITTRTFGKGNAGNVSIQAAESLLVTSNSFLQASTGGLGKGGGIFINTNTLEVNQEGSIESTATGSGNAGNIGITANRMQLNDRSTISTSTTRSDGGDITLNIRDLLLMRRNSSISTTAGTAQAGGNGGNITINAPRGFLVSAPNENNDIKADAFSGSGGNITINAAGIYWFTPRNRADLERLLGNPPFDPNRLPTNDITASSELGISGTIALNTLNFDPSRGLAQLPQNLIDTNRILANSCIVRDAGTGGTFYITGAGGLPVRPGDAVLPTFATGDVRGIEAAPKASNGTTIAEAQEIYQLPDGQIVLSWECPQ